MHRGSRRRTWSRGSAGHGVRPRRWIPAARGSGRSPDSRFRPREAAPGAGRGSRPGALRMASRPLPRRWCTRAPQMVHQRAPVLSYLSLLLSLGRPGRALPAGRSRQAPADIVPATTAVMSAPTLGPAGAAGRRREATAADPPLPSAPRGVSTGAWDGGQKSQDRPCRGPRVAVRGRSAPGVSGRFTGRPQTLAPVRS